MYNDAVLLGESNHNWHFACAFYLFYRAGVMFFIDRLFTAAYHTHATKIIYRYHLTNVKIGYLWTKSHAIILSKITDDIMDAL